MATTLDPDGWVGLWTADSKLGRNRPRPQSYALSSGYSPVLSPAVGGAVLLSEFPHFHKQRAIDY
jgi:hypothetical protein